jgi:type II secretory pathway pseudopilin PulG
VRPGREREEDGFSLVMLMAALTMMLIGMAAAVPSWQYVIQDDKEQELLSRGGQIADAIQAYQQKNGNALPTTLDVLVKGHFLRRPYKDPMTRDGQWKFIHQGEAVAAPGTPGAQGGGQAPGALRPSPSPTPAPFGSSAGTTTIGPFMGVASRSTKKSFRVMNNAKTYDTWLFIAGQQRIVGKTPINAAAAAPGAPRPSGAPPAGPPAGPAQQPQPPPAGAGGNPGMP